MCTMPTLLDIIRERQVESNKCHETLCVRPRYLEHKGDDIMRKSIQFSAILGSVALLAVAIGAAPAQDAAPILNHTFEQNDGGWQGMGTGAPVVSVTHDTGIVKTGKG